MKGFQLFKGFVYILAGLAQPFMMPLREELGGVVAVLLIMLGVATIVKARKLR